ncbi:S-layer homology domain-containing protein [Cohnella nanjingensis]|uniref:S-layer homology domain-containing protein n=1 Tax=Cohnella nanjingensis TaxID=1387779 RepID=A0A7X0RTC8_9BACL|nr:S-layer homology domain-containing protein [Cohnella nanjingensis]
MQAWAKGAVAAGHADGIVKGREGNKFDPNATATSAEAVVMNMLQSLNKGMFTGPSRDFRPLLLRLFFTISTIYPPIRGIFFDFS